MLFSKITLSGSIEEWKEGMGEHSTSQGWREQKAQESKELLRPDRCSSRTVFRVQYDIPFQVSLARLHPLSVYTVYPKLQYGSNIRDVCHRAGLCAKETGRSACSVWRMQEVRL